MSAEEEGFENLNTMASTFIVLFLLSLFYSTTVTLFKVGRRAPGGHEAAEPQACGPPAPLYPLTLSLLPAGEVMVSQEHAAPETGQEGLPWSRGPGLCGLSACTEIFPACSPASSCKKLAFLGAAECHGQAWSPQSYAPPGPALQCCMCGLEINKYTLSYETVSS